MTKQKELEVEDAMAEYVISYEGDVLDTVNLEVSDEALETAGRTDSARCVTLAACTVYLNALRQFDMASRRHLI